MTPWKEIFSSVDDGGLSGRLLCEGIVPCEDFLRAVGDNGDVVEFAELKEPTVPVRVSICVCMFWI